MCGAPGACTTLQAHAMAPVVAGGVCWACLGCNVFGGEAHRCSSMAVPVIVTKHQSPLRRLITVNTTTTAFTALSAEIEDRFPPD